jgi:hypothetical protein
VALTPFVLSAMMLAMNPQWSVVDLPYPEVSGGQAAVPSVDALISEAVANYARGRIGKPLNTKPEISGLKVDNSVATLKASYAGRTESLVLMRIANEWRVVQTPEGKDF